MVPDEAADYVQVDPPAVGVPGVDGNSGETGEFTQTVAMNQNQKSFSAVRRLSA